MKSKDGVLWWRLFSVVPLAPTSADGIASVAVHTFIPGWGSSSWPLGMSSLSHFLVIIAALSSKATCQRLTRWMSDTSECRARCQPAFWSTSLPFVPSLCLVIYLFIYFLGWLGDGGGEAETSLKLQCSDVSEFTGLNQTEETGYEMESECLCVCLSACVCVCVVFFLP